MVLCLSELASIGVHAVSSVHEGSGRRDLIGKVVTQGLWASAFISLAIAACIPLCGVYFEALGLGGAAATTMSLFGLTRRRRR